VHHKNGENIKQIVKNMSAATVVFKIIVGCFDNSCKNSRYLQTSKKCKNMGTVLFIFVPMVFFV